jgi:hypothetical protein
MRLWPRRKPYERKLVPAVLPDAGPSLNASLEPPNGAMNFGSMPAQFEPNGEAKVYEDEIDPQWRDPDTTDPSVDGDH